MKTYSFRSKKYPEYLKHGCAMQYIYPIARHWCEGKGLDIGAGAWPLPVPGIITVDIKDGGSAYDLPEGQFDFIFSSHCLEHLNNPIETLRHWRSRLKPGGVMFLYLPHPDMEYWHPGNCKKHVNKFHPEWIESVLRVIGFEDIFISGRDLFWSFAAVGKLKSGFVD